MPMWYPDIEIIIIPLMARHFLLSAEASASTAQDGNDSHMRLTKKTLGIGVGNGSWTLPIAFLLFL